MEFISGSSLNCEGLWSGRKRKEVRGNWALIILESAHVSFSFFFPPFGFENSTSVLKRWHFNLWSQFTLSKLDYWESSELESSIFSSPEEIIFPFPMKWSNKKSFKFTLFRQQPDWWKVWTRKLRAKVLFITDTNCFFLLKWPLERSSPFRAFSLFLPPLAMSFELIT